MADSLRVLEEQISSCFKAQVPNTEKEGIPFLVNIDIATAVSGPSLVEFQCTFSRIDAYLEEGGEEVIVAPHHHQMDL